MKYQQQHLVAPSILAANFANLQHDVEMVNHSEADCLHLDVMDGRFVPNISFGFPVIKAINKYATKALDIHLMIVEPDKYINHCVFENTRMITVHYEACTHLHRSIAAIKEAGIKAGIPIQAGVALNPHTPVALLADIIRDVDLVCLMSVNPGFGGQSFIPQTLNKIRQLRHLMEQQKTNAFIEIDGGVKLDNAGAILKAGANVLVAGSTVFKSQNPTETIQQLKCLRPEMMA